MRSRSRTDTYGADEAPETHPRLFVAIPLADAARSAVVALADEVRAVVDSASQEPRSEVRWVRMDGLHLTLRFLGATDPSRVADVARVVDDVGVSQRPFRITVRGAGAFPSASRPRTVWLGIDEGREELGRLSQRLSEGLVAAGWPADERPFRAHLTLARADGRREGPLVARTLVQRAAEFETSWVAERVVLFESLTGGGRARYAPVHEVALPA